jgi:hypothetical protein
MLAGFDLGIGQLSGVLNGAFNSQFSHGNNPLC